MGPTTILSLLALSYRAIVAGAKLAKRLAPVLAVLGVLCAKLAAGDFSGLPELLSALVAAAAAVHSGAKVAQLSTAFRATQAGAPNA